MPKKLKLALAVEGVDLHDDDQIEDLMEALPDVHWKKSAGQVQAIALLDRHEQDVVAAVRGIAAAVTAVVPDAHVIDVVEDFVSISDIAKRSSFTRQYARMLVTGERGPGGFPRPLGSVGKTQVWDWASVSQWLQTHYELGDSYQLLGRDELAEVRRAIATPRPAPRREAVEASTHLVGVQGSGKVIRLDRHRHTHEPHFGRGFLKAAEAYGEYAVPRDEGRPRGFSLVAS